MNYIRLFLLCVALTACSFSPEQGITSTHESLTQTQDTTPTITSLSENTSTSTNTPPPTTTPVPILTEEPTPSTTPFPSTTPTPTVNEIASYLGYENGECMDCVLQDTIPGYPRIRKELWSEENGVKAYWTEKSGWKSTEGWAGVLRGDIAFSGEGFVQDPVQRNGGIYQWRGVMDGISVEQPYEIADSEGTIFENVYSTSVYSLDDESRLTSSIVPHIVKVNDQIVVLNAADLIFEEIYGLTTTEEIKDKFKEKFIRGKNLYFILRPNGFVSEGKSRWGEWSEDIRNLWNRYQAEYSKDYQDFLDNSTPPDVLITLTYGGDFIFDEKYLELP